MFFTLLIQQHSRQFAQCIKDISFASVVIMLDINSISLFGKKNIASVGINNPMYGTP